jgi:hypothetical protein
MRSAFGSINSDDSQQSNQHLKEKQEFDFLIGWILLSKVGYTM